MELPQLEAVLLLLQHGRLPLQQVAQRQLPRLGP
jgi:hypothetical protein